MRQRHHQLAFPLALALGDVLARLARLRPNGAGPWQQGQPVFGGQDATQAAVKNRHTQLLLQPFELLAQGRLGCPQGPRSGSQAARVRNLGQQHQGRWVWGGKGTLRRRFDGLGHGVLTQLAWLAR